MMTVYAYKGTIGAGYNARVTSTGVSTKNALDTALYDKDGNQLGDSSHPMYVTVAGATLALDVGDVEIGAVELKDGISGSDHRIGFETIGTSTYAVPISMWGYTGSAYKRLTLDVDGHLQADVLTLPSITIANTGFKVSDGTHELGLIDTGSSVYGSPSVLKGYDGSAYRTVKTSSNGELVSGASENHLGEVGGSSAQIAPTVTVDAGAYAQYDCLCDKLTITDAMRVNGGTGLLQSLFIMDKSTTLQKPGLELILFNDNPSASTITKNSPLSIHADDISKVIRRIPVNSSDYTALSATGPSIADLSPGTRVLKSAAASKDLYAAVMCTGTPTPTATTDMVIRFGIIRD